MRSEVDRFALWPCNRIFAVTFAADGEESIVSRLCQTSMFRDLTDVYSVGVNGRKVLMLCGVFREGKLSYENGNGNQ